MFVEYNKIENSSKKWDENYKKVKQWAVTEKVHGANFSFIYNTDTATFNCARRNGILEENEFFYNHKSVMNDNIQYLNNIINKIKELNINFQSIIIYGEIFGGLYPNFHSKIKAVQKGVFYSPNIHFYAFDIYICNGEEGYYLDFEKTLNIFKESGIMYCEPLAIFNNVTDALNYNYTFNSTIYKKFGLPEVPNNKAEGVVIKSMTNRYVVKLKTDEFCETVALQSGNKHINTTNKNNIFEIAKTHITQNRFNNAVSKVGPDNVNEIINIFVDDIIFELDITDDKLIKNVKSMLYKETNSRLNEFLTNN